MGQNASKCDVALIPWKLMLYFTHLFNYKLHRYTPTDDASCQISHIAITPSMNYQMGSAINIPV